MLTLFCDTFGHLVTILDDSEFYDSGEPFSPHEYALLGQFLNQFLLLFISAGSMFSSPRNVTFDSIPKVAGIHSFKMFLKLSLTPRIDSSHVYPL